MLYRITLGTGLRTSKIAPLTPADFDLDATPPTITVEGAYTKNRKTAVQPIRPDLAERLLPWLEGKNPIKPAFSVNVLRQNTARWMRKDLAAIEIRYVNDDGKIADFHALRHTYVTEVVRAGANVKEAQSLARHSAPEVTFRVYAHANLHDLMRTLERMPGTAPERSTMENAV